MKFGYLKLKVCVNNGSGAHALQSPKFGLKFTESFKSDKTQSYAVTCDCAQCQTSPRYKKLK